VPDLGFVRSATRSVILVDHAVAGEHALEGAGEFGVAVPDEVSRAERSGLARGAFAAEATLASARGGEARLWSPLREALVEVKAVPGLVRRAGTNLNQAVAKLNATGRAGEDLLPAAQFCARVIRRLDEAAEQLRRSVP
jgi:hypothetical protein